MDYKKEKKQMQRIFSMELAGRTITAETGKYAEQAGGSVLMRCGDTAVLVCATVAKAPRDGVDFLPRVEVRSFLGGIPTD